jgi:Domain of unknown function(DUF2779)
MSFERQRIEELAELFPHLSDELLSVADKLVDLQPIVKNYVYHPSFGGSFSLKRCFPR